MKSTDSLLLIAGGITFCCSLIIIGVYIYLDDNESSDLFGGGGKDDNGRPKRSRNVDHDTWNTTPTPESTPGKPPPQIRRNCTGEWSECNIECYRTYTVTSPAVNGGNPCPYANYEISKTAGGVCPIGECDNRHLHPDALPTYV